MGSVVLLFVKWLLCTVHGYLLLWFLHHICDVSVFCQINYSSLLNSEKKKKKESQCVDTSVGSGLGSWHSPGVSYNVAPDHGAGGGMEALTPLSAALSHPSKSNANSREQISLSQHLTVLLLLSSAARFLTSKLIYSCINM